MDITAKLTILRIGCYNFRSCGVFSKEQPFHIIDFTKMTNTLVVSDDNGSGKSTLYKHLLDYCLTGKNSVDNDNVDALINTENHKQGMLTFIEWHFAGNTYRSDRGRGKLKQFEISKLINGEFIPIPDLPTKDGDRQVRLYSLTGLDKNNAAAVIEATMVLGVEKFKSFISLKTQDKRDIFEPIFGCTEFSSWNETAKAERTKVVLEQKQTGLEITDLNSKSDLAAQSVIFKQQEMNTLETSYKARREVLVGKLNHYTVELKEASEVDTSGLDLKLFTETSVAELTGEVIGLEAKLNEDIRGLGKFKIDKTDEILVKLSENLRQVDVNLETSRKGLQDKEDSLSSEVTDKITHTKDLIEEEDTEHEKASEKLLEDFGLESLRLSKELSSSKEIYDTGVKDYNESVLHHQQCVENVENLKKCLIETSEKEGQYEGKCKKLSDAIVYLTAQLEQEENNLKGLVSAGECPTCKSLLSEGYVGGLKLKLNTKISSIKNDIQTYTERFDVGKQKIVELDVKTLREGLSVAELQMNQVTPNENIKTTALKDWLKATDDFEAFSEKNPLKELNQQHDIKLLQLQSVLDKAESEAKEFLGKIEAEYNQLAKNAPSQKEALHQQIKDREISMRGEHGGKETLLRSVYKNECTRIEREIEQVKVQLTKELERIVREKDKTCNKYKVDVESLEKEITALEEGNKKSVRALQKEYDKALTKQFCIASDLTQLNKKHDAQQHDIEDWDNVLIMISEKEGKADVISYYLDDLNRNINKYLNALNLFINVKVDSGLNITMEDETRKNQSLHSLSVGQKARVNVSIMLALRDVATSRNGMEANVLVLDEILSNFSEQGTIEVVEMLKQKFSDLNLVVISQNKTAYSELFEEVKEYGLRGGFTVELQNED